MRTMPAITVAFLLTVSTTPSSAAGIWGGQVPEHLWSKGIGGSGNDEAYSVAVDPAGNVVIVGHFSNSVDFGGGALVSAGAFDIFVAKYDANGAHISGASVSAARALTSPPPSR